MNIKETFEKKTIDTYKQKNVINFNNYTTKLQLYYKRNTK